MPSDLRRRTLGHMSPDDIAHVHRTWWSALTELDLLLRAVAARLPGTPSFRVRRAYWVVRSVSHLAPLLDHPTTFEPVAADLIASRFPVTLDELGCERDALLGALNERCGGLSDAELRAWEAAIGLFAEIVCAVGQDPFGSARPTVGAGVGDRP